jgi:hypothetical protein
MAGTQRLFNLTLQLGGKISSSLNKAFKDVESSVKKLGSSSQAATASVDAGFSAATRSAHQFNAATTKANQNLAKVAQTAAKVQKQNIAAAKSGGLGNMLGIGALGLTGAAIGGAFLAKRILGGFVSDAIQASREQLTNELSLALETSLRNNPGLQDREVADQKKRIEDLAESMRKYSAIDDATFRAGFTQLSTFGAKAKGIEMLSKAFADWLAMTKELGASPEDAKNLADKIGVAVSTGELGKFRKELKLTDDQVKQFKQLKTSGERIEFLRKAMEGRAGGRAQTLAGSWQGQAAIAKQEVDQIMSIYGDSFRKIEGTWNKISAKVLSSLLPYLQPMIDSVGGSLQGLLDNIDVKTDGLIKKLKDIDIGSLLKQLQDSEMMLVQGLDTLVRWHVKISEICDTLHDRFVVPLEKAFSNVAKFVTGNPLAAIQKQVPEIIEDQNNRAKKGGTVESQVNPNAFPKSPEMDRYIEKQKKANVELEKLHRTTEDLNYAFIELGYLIHPANTAGGVTGASGTSDAAGPTHGGTSGIVPGTAASGNYRAMGFGPAAGDTNHAANYSDYGSGPLETGKKHPKHLLLPNDIALSPNLLGKFPMGTYVNIVDHKTGKVLYEHQKVADTSWVPGKKGQGPVPSVNSFEQRHVQDMGHADLEKWEPKVPLKGDGSSAAPASGHTINAPVTIHVHGVPDKRTADEVSSRMHGSIREHIDMLDDARRSRRRTMLT